MKAVIILGSPNDEQGNLLSIARERLPHGIREYLACPGSKILLTGGFGPHFNRTDKPHAYYAKQFLLKNGIEEKDFLEFALSYDTVQDAVLSKPILLANGIKEAIVVTSDFHMERTKRIFTRVLNSFNLVFSSCATNLPRESLESLNDHEKRMLAQLDEERFEKKFPL